MSHHAIFVTSLSEVQSIPDAGKYKMNNNGEFHLAIKK